MPHPQALASSQEPSRFKGPTILDQDDAVTPGNRDRTVGEELLRKGSKMRFLRAFGVKLGFGWIKPLNLDS